MTLDDGWDLIEYTLAANQLLADWKSKKYSWREEQNKIDIESALKLLYFDARISEKDKRNLDKV